MKLTIADILIFLVVIASTAKVCLSPAADLMDAVCVVAGLAALGFATWLKRLEVKRDDLLEKSIAYQDARIDALVNDLKSLRSALALKRG